MQEKLIVVVLMLFIHVLLCYPNTYHDTIKSKTFKRYNEIDENSQDFWKNNAKKFVFNQLLKKINRNVAKNVIFFIGDGMSATTIAATRLYLGGEEKELFFENFPFTGLARTYCINKRVPDSACTSTAYLTGVKSQYGTIGVNGHVNRKNCTTMADVGTHTYSIADWAMKRGKAAGFVTNTRVTHASPAGMYAHIADRNWESDSEIECLNGTKAKVKDIAQQLVDGDIGSQLRVILGGGREKFHGKYSIDEYGNRGKRLDERNLTHDWLRNQTNRAYVTNRDQLMKVNISQTDALLGLFAASHMMYHLETNDREFEQPSLAEMTTKAIEILSKEQNGFFLFVEGGKIDLAHHDVYAELALDETAEFSKAISTAFHMTNSNDTLIVVSADHSHTITISGYPDRGQDILSYSQKSDVDHLPYMTLNYANGNGFYDFFDTSVNKRRNLTKVPRDGFAMKFPSALPIKSETHGGEDVVVYASGPWSHLFTGSYEQTSLPHMMAYAACIGYGLQSCD